MLGNHAQASHLLSVIIFPCGIKQFVAFNDICVLAFSFIQQRDRLWFHLIVKNALIL